MNRVAVNCHSNYKVPVYEDVERAGQVECDFFFAKGVSLMYAYSDEEAMCEMLTKTRLAVFDYTFAREGGRIVDHVGTGLGVTYLSLDKCKRLVESHKDKVLVLKPYVIKQYHQGVDRVTYDCIYGEKELIEGYLGNLERSTGENLENYDDPKFIRQEVASIGV